MSMPIYKLHRPLPSTYLPELRRQVWGRLFGRFIQGRRNEINMPVDEAAGLSGMAVSEWMAIEEGHVPQDMDRLRAISASLELTWDRMLNMLALCQEAWTL
jgi:transcriptional regulator with XRE-family HTH domain